MREEVRLDPWGVSVVKDYGKLMSVFGIRPFKELLPRVKSPHPLMRRGVIFGHRDYDLRVLEPLRRGERVALLTGFMPSGRFHFGHKLLVDQIVYYQKLGLDVFIVIADAEAYAVRRVGRREGIEVALSEYVANMIALGLEKKRLRMYFQTNYEPEYYRLAQMFSRKVTMAELEAIYGELEPAKIMAALTQAADILHPQLECFGGIKNVLVPVGADQDPHIRLARDMADRFGRELGLERPAASYHRLMMGLDGGKMSSSRPDSAIFVTDDEDEVRSKILRALTGGRATAEEQRREGGVPERCSVYEFYLYHLLESDSDVRKLYEECREGRILCGECKLRAFELISKWIEAHKRRLESAKSRVLEYVEPPSF